MSYDLARPKKLGDEQWSKHACCGHLAGSYVRTSFSFSSSACCSCLYLISALLRISSSSSRSISSSSSRSSSAALFDSCKPNQASGQRIYHDRPSRKRTQANPHWTPACKFRRKSFDLACVQCERFHSQQQVSFALRLRVQCGLGLTLQFQLLIIMRGLVEIKASRTHWNPAFGQGAPGPTVKIILLLATLTLT